MLCEKCVKEFVLPRLREDDIIILQYLYNNEITLPQVAKHKNIIENETHLSRFRNMMALARLEGYSLIAIQPWSKASNYYITEFGTEALTTLSQKLGGE